MVISALGGIALATHHFRELYERRHEPGKRQKMIAFAGIIFFSTGLIGSIVAYSWTNRAFPLGPLPKELPNSSSSLDYTVKLRCDAMLSPPKDDIEQPLQLVQLMGPPGPGGDPKSYVTTTTTRATLVRSFQLEIYQTYKCALINYGNETLLGVRAKLTVVWNKAEDIEGGSRGGDFIASTDYYSPAVDILGKEGTETVFYIRSSSESFASLEVLGQISFRLTGSDAVQNAKLITPTKMGEWRAMFIPRSDYIKGRQGSPRVILAPTRHSEKAARAPSNRHNLSEVGKRSKDGSF